MTLAYGVNIEAGNGHLRFKLGEGMEVSSYEDPEASFRKAVAVNSGSVHGAIVERVTDRSILSAIGAEKGDVLAAFWVDGRRVRSYVLFSSRRINASAASSPS